MRKFKLGRKALVTDSRTLRLNRYLSPNLAPPPPSADWTKGIASFGEMLNDRLGDCTIAGVGHAVQIVTANTGTEVTVPDSTVQHYYESWDGYNPNDPATDQGGIELDVLNNWKKQGFAGHKLDAFADPNVSNHTEIMQAIALCGGLYIGMEVPNFIMGDTIPALWDVVADDGGIDGGHCVYCCGYDTAGVSFISWGSLYKMTWAYWDKYVDEAHALILEDWFAASGVDPTGLNLSQLTADVQGMR